MTHAERTPKEVTDGLGLTRSRILLSVFFGIAGLMHFLRPGMYVAIVPPWLPNSEILVLLSGSCEILGGLGVLHPATRRFAGWGLIALLIAVFPANVQMLHLAYVSHASALWKLALWLRLPLQIPLIWWAWHSAARRAP
jgi:uncharacterized membrane protein